MADAAQLFDAEALTIGFARRFATYKRATLVLRDLDRLERILCDPSARCSWCSPARRTPPTRAAGPDPADPHPVERPPLPRRVLFLEDYDMSVGRALTRGVDVWLNNPRRPLEASGRRARRRR
jgi:glycogen phosphorylase